MNWLALLHTCTPVIELVSRYSACGIKKKNKIMVQTALSVFLQKNTVHSNINSRCNFSFLSIVRVCIID